MAKFNISQTSKVTNVTYPQPQVDRFQSPIIINGVHIGGVGGNTTQAGQQIQPTVKIGSNSATTGNIIAQKGSHKFRVLDNATPANVGTCKLVNLATPTASNTMSIQVNTAVMTSANLTSTTGSATTFAYITYGTANLSAYSTPAVGSVFTLTGLTSTVTANAVNATVAGVANLTVTFSSQTVSNIANTGTFSTVFYASKINNKYVWDFGSDGQPTSAGGTGTYTGNANNPNRYRYYLGASPNAQLVQVKSA
jgi:hypothetical protein